MAHSGFPLGSGLPPSRLGFEIGFTLPTSTVAAVGPAVSSGRMSCIGRGRRQRWSGRQRPAGEQDQTENFEPPRHVSPQTPAKPKPVANSAVSLAPTTLSINTAHRSRRRSSARTGQCCRRDTSSKCQMAGPREYGRNGCRHRMADLPCVLNGFWLAATCEDEFSGNATSYACMDVAKYAW